MTERKKVSAGTKWGDEVGYSRAIRVGNVIEVAGTTAFKEGEVVGVGDAYFQGIYIIKKIHSALSELGGSLNDVIRTRIFITDISAWDGVAKAHGEFFSGIKPASTMVVVSGLAHPDMLVEIEATAILDQ
ncbi:MAG TPA: RidA family protein [Ignavibacteria bacterium]|nr:RidA family protein [Ignavibacteria bacterium]